jgi:hypothetical protein
MTLAYWACFKDSTRIILAAPQKLLVLEDLAVFIELSELRRIFNKTVASFIDYSKQEYFLPSQNVPEFYINFRDIVKNDHSQIIYEKRSMYIASVIRKVHSTFNNNMVTCDNDLIQNLFRHW